MVSPDISPDSLTGEFLYYSSNCGTTLVVKDSAAYPWTYSAIAADYEIGNVYKKTRENLYHSGDYGASWHLRVVHVGYNDMLSSGYSLGEVYESQSSYVIRSSNFGIDYDTVGRSSSFGRNCLGWESGELFLLNQIYGQFYHSTDTLTTWTQIYDFGYRNSHFVRRGRLGDLYILSPTSILYSADYGSTFVNMNSFPFSFSWSAQEGTLDDIVGGMFSGELYGVDSYFHENEYYWQRGGSIKICYSRNFGATFTCMTHSAEGITFDTLSGIKETGKPERMRIGVYPNPFNTNCRILSRPSSELEIFDLQGRFIESGATDYMGMYIWSPSDLPAGLYLVKINNDFGKVFYAK
ncbi:T9SS type A sorting domain-containing protein [bacterium]|nr:T9SS type A sorting domain-containing protein [bacterium]